MVVSHWLDKNIRCWWLIVIMVTVTSPPALPAAFGPLAPRYGCYIGAYIHQDPVVKDDIGAFENLTGKSHTSYMCYLGYGEPFPFEWVQNVLSHGALPQIAWEPNNGLDEVRDDEYLRGWAQAARRVGGPILLRYASEMNGDWMPYSGNPKLYKDKWRIVCRVMRQTAPNVVMVWCPFATPRRTIALYYPGDSYVDWVGVNIYAVVYHDGDLSRPAPNNQLDDLRFIYKLFGDRKPIAICEYAATHYCAASSQPATAFARQQMGNMYRAIQEQFPNVVLINWFSVDAASDKLADNDYAVTSDPEVLAAYRRAVGSDYFLAQLPPEVVQEAATLPPPTSAPLALAGRSIPAAKEVIILIKGASSRAVSGQVVVQAAVGQQLDADTVEFYIDKRFRAITNIRPYSYRWNAGYYEPGEHIIKVVIRDSDDTVVAEQEAAVIVADSQ